MDEGVRSAVVRYVLESERDALVVLDADGHVVLSNGAARNVDLALAELFDAPVLDMRIAGFLEGLRSSGKSFMLVASDAGSVYRLEGVAIDGWLVIVARDVSVRRESDEGLGAVGAELVHDLNNLLAPILMTSSLLVRGLDEGSKEGDMASVIHTGATLAAALTRDVLALVRPRAEVVERVHVNEAVEEIRSLLDRLLPDHVELVLTLDRTAGVAVLDRRRLELAILNLVVNARDALLESGRVTIATQTVEQGGRRWIRLSVADTGVGMTEDVRRQAFDSFFTTKAASGGLGLGLPSVQRFASDSGAVLSIDSAPSRGTTVTMLFEEAPVEEPPPKSTRTDEIALVAAGDDHLRRAIHRSLRADGYHVLSAADPRSALELASDHAIDVAIVDGRFVRRGARVFLHGLRVRSPNLRLVITTESDVAEVRSSDGIAVLPEAFTEEELLRAVRREPAACGGVRNVGC